MVVIESREQEARQAANLERLAGPIVSLLRDALTTDVVINADESIWVNRLGSGWSRRSQFDRASARLLLQGIAKMRDIPLNHEHPIIETIFPLTGDRIEGLIPPVVDGAVFAIRTRQRKMYSLEELESSGVLTNKHDAMNRKRHKDDFLEQALACGGHREVLRLASRYRRNLLMVGPTGSGKTTISNSIIWDWLAATPDDRVVILEDTPELQCSLPNHVQLLATRHVTQADLLVAAMRLIPKRVVLGEIREEEPARVLLNAWNTGHSGGLCTLHANDALAGLRKFEALVGGHTASVRERIASAINLVVFIEGDEEILAGRKVREVMVVRGLDAATGDYSVEFV